MTQRLLGGPDLGFGPESLNDHRRRLGSLPHQGAQLIGTLEASGLLGRGGASFPVGTKWRTVAGAAGPPPVVLVNGAEGEPLSYKDRTLMSARPHLVLDGAVLAAEAVKAQEIVLYIGDRHKTALAAMSRALGERSAKERRLTRIVRAPVSYISGEESAAVHYVNEGLALPTTVPPRPFQKGVKSRPTLVQNVESLAHAALIARHGHGWYRSVGVAGGAGTLLVTVNGAAGPGVREIEAGTTVGEVLTQAGGVTSPPQAVLLGGFFGTWVDAHEAWQLPLDAGTLRERGLSLGCGVIAVLPQQACGVCESSRVMNFLAAASSAQCGPCFFGLRALAETVERIARGEHREGDLGRLNRWSQDVRGRGACRHPDGAVGFLRSALQVFTDDFEHHSAHEHRQAA